MEILLIQSISIKLIKATLKSKWNTSALSSPPNGVLRKNECKTAPHWSHSSNLHTFQSLTWCPCAPTRAVASCSWQWTGGHIRCRQRASPPGGIACAAPAKLRAGTPVEKSFKTSEVIKWVGSLKPVYPKSVKHGGKTTLLVSSLDQQKTQTKP